MQQRCCCGGALLLLLLVVYQSSSAGGLLRVGLCGQKADRGPAMIAVLCLQWVTYSTSKLKVAVRPA